MCRVILTCALLLFAFTGFAQTDVLTQHGDNGRTGWNQTETELKVSNVTPTTFGLLTSRTVDDEIFSQPLVVSGVNINGGAPKNVVYVTTVNNSIYAFDADDVSQAVYWNVNLTTPSNRPPRSTDMHPADCSTYNDFYSVNNALGYGIFGIVGTPVIDKPSNTMYVVSRDVNATQVDQGPHSDVTAYTSAGFFQYLHAIDIRTGAEKTGSPVLITATANGTAPGSSGGIITFDPRRENQRGGLTLMNGIVYIPYAAHCDWNNYHGWVLGYDATTLVQKIVWISSPDDGRGGIWMSGGGIAADPNANGGIGSLYLATGNAFKSSSNTYADPSILQNRGESIVKLNPDAAGGAATKLNIADYFSPYNYAYLNDLDLDFGTQVMLVPGSQLLVSGCKDYSIYTFDKSNLGGFNATQNNNLQKIPVANQAGMHSSFAYFGGTTNKFLYQFSEYTNLKAYAVSNMALSTSPINGVGNGPTGIAGAYMSTSSNGSDESTGILWISHAEPGCNANQGSCPAILRAVQATNVNNEIWNSDMNSTDKVGVFSKNTCPTIANGKVYEATMSKKLNIYGLLASNPRCVTNVALNKPATDSRPAADPAGRAFDGVLGYNNSWWLDNKVNAYLQVDLGASYDICKITITWDGAAGLASAYDIQVADNPAGPWTTVISVTNNTTTYNEFTGSYNGRYVRMQASALSATGSGYRIDEMTVLGELATSCIKPANVAATNITTNTATISWDPVAGAAKGYYLKYKTPTVASWVTRTTTNPAIALGALSCGTDYSVELQSICSSSDQSAVSSVTFTTDNCATACNLPTRYARADIGDIGVAGSSCSDATGTIFTVKGSGKDIGGNDDEFQFAFVSLSGDETFTAHLSNQDNFGANKAGVMMRDSLSNTSRFAYVSITSGAGAQFIYRTAPNGPVTVVQGPVVSAPYYVSLKKLGNTYTGYISPSGLTGTWTQIGTTSLPFGSGTVYPGLAVTSADDSKLSTAVFDLFEESAPLPITLLNFTATNVNNEYVSLKWTTSMEQNNDHFLIERSSDGVHFETLATVKSAGNSSVNQDYSLADNHPVNGIDYYRIKQYDVDGKFALYPLAMVRFGVGAGPVAYPNPASTTVNVVSGEEAIQSVALFDLLGKQIQLIKNPGSAAMIQVKINSLESGTYILKITTPSKVYQQKVMKN